MSETATTRESADMTHTRRTLALIAAAVAVLGFLLTTHTHHATPATPTAAVLTADPASTLTGDLAIEDTTDPTIAETVAHLATLPGQHLDTNHDGTITADEQGFDCLTDTSGFVLYVAADGGWACGER